MPLKERKLRKRHRGTRNCGRGKKGSRKKGGGRGLAGSSKHKFSWIVKNMPDHFGHEKMKGAKKPKGVNVGYLNEFALTKGIKEVNAGELGFGKVLGGGKVTGPITVKAKAFTEAAKEKIEKAGGKTIVE